MIELIVPTLTVFTFYFTLSEEPSAYSGAVSRNLGEGTKFNGKVVPSTRLEHSRNAALSHKADMLFYL